MQLTRSLALLILATNLAAQTGTFTVYGGGCVGVSDYGWCGFRNRTTQLAATQLPRVNYALLANVGPTALKVGGIHLFCGLRSGPSGIVEFWFYDRDLQGRPGKIIGSGLMRMMTTVQLNTGVLIHPITLPANLDYFIVFSNALDLRLPIMTTGTPVTHYQGGPSNWSGPHTSYNWNYRLSCDQPEPVPTISNTGVPTINKSFLINLQSSSSNSPASLILGLTRTSTQLTFKCWLYTSPLHVTTFMTNSAGNLSIQQALPNDPRLVGVPVYMQFGIFDPKKNWFGFSNGAEVRAGV